MNRAVASREVEPDLFGDPPLRLLAETGQSLHETLLACVEQSLCRVDAETIVELLGARDADAGNASQPHDSVRHLRAQSLEQPRLARTQDLRSAESQALSDARKLGEAALLGEPLEALCRLDRESALLVRAGPKGVRLEHPQVGANLTKRRRYASLPAHHPGSFGALPVSSR